MSSLGPQNHSKALSGSVLNISPLRSFGCKCALNNLETEEESAGGRLRHMLLKGSACKISYVALSTHNSLFTMNLHMKHSTCFSSKLTFFLDKTRGLQALLQAENQNQGPRHSTDLQEETALNLRAPFKDRRQN